MTMPEPTFWKDRHGYVKGGWVVAFWALGVGAVIGLLVFIFAYAYPTWWEDHKTERGRGDAAVTRIAQDSESEDGNDEVWTIEMPDDFSNFATRCVWEGYRGFSSTGDGGAFVVPDETCEMPNFVAPEEVEP